MPARRSGDSGALAKAPASAISDLLWVALGAVPGALLRWRLGVDPLANLIGCFVLGVITAQQSTARPVTAHRLRLCGGIGFCGSLTTFSGWMLQTLQLAEQGGYLEAAPMVLSLLGGGLVTFAIGQLTWRRISGFGH